MIPYALEHVKRHSDPNKMPRKWIQEDLARAAARASQPAIVPLPKEGPLPPWRRYLPQCCAVMVKNILLLAYGMTLGFPTIVIPAVQGGSGQEGDDLVLSDSQISWFSSINLIVVPIGCIFSGPYTHSIGRRRAMQIIAIPILTSWLLFHYATNVTMLYIGLVLSGVSGGLMEAPVLTYVAEVTEPAIRGALSGTGSLFIIIGVTVQFLLGTFLPWREVALWSIVFPVIAFFLLFFIPESPYWLLLKKRANDAHNSLAWLRGWVEPEAVQKELVTLQERIESNLLDSRIMHETTCLQKSRAFQRRSFIVPFILVSLAFFIGHFSGMTTLQTYAVQIFNTLKAPIDKYYATLLLGLVEVLGALICISCIHYTGKRPLTFISTIGCGICFLLTATYAHFLDDIPGLGITNVVANASDIDLSGNFSSHDLVGAGPESALSRIFIPLADEEENSKYAWVPLTLLLGSALLSHSGIRLLPWILIGEVFPSNVRAAGAGFASGMGYLGGFLANKFFLNMVSSMTLPGTFWFYSAVSFLGAIVLYFLLPETEGRTLLEIEDHFTGKRSLYEKSERQKKISTTSKTSESRSKKVSRTELGLDTWEANQIFEQKLHDHNFNPREVLNEHKKGKLLITVPSGASIASKKSTVSQVSETSTGGRDNRAFEPDIKKDAITHL